MAKQKFYVVWQGHKPGVYDTWAECQTMTRGFPSAEFKSFSNKDIAEQEFKLRGSSTSISKEVNKKKDDIFEKGENPNINYNTICVDGACAGNPGYGEYQCVDVKTNENIFVETGFEHTTNNIMEFLALVDGLKWLKEKNDDRAIYSDSITAITWVRNKKCKSTLKENNKNFDSIKKIALAERWLLENEYETNILKWDTRGWGEIPADFGRK